MTRRGRLITLEGGEGTGKSTQIRQLSEFLQTRIDEVLTTREPGGSPGAEAIRGLLVRGDTGRWSPFTEALLHYAARRDHLEKTVWPALERGAWVVCDRFADSTFAYQGGGHGLEREAIARLHRLTLGNFAPDLTLILDLPVEEGLSRARARAGGEDRYERMDPAFHHRLHGAFLDLARREPKRCVLVDASGPPDTVAERVREVVVQRLGVAP